ncbi:MAG: hypothetical protein M2R46_00573 [Verrucomicrobia subdivision 3 bacterium]|nr:hypothetical protein [Limisphaerales bacterium]
MDNGYPEERRNRAGMTLVELLLPLCLAGRKGG